MAEKTNTPVKKTTTLSSRSLCILMLRHPSMSTETANQTIVVPLMPRRSATYPPRTRPTTPPMLSTRSWVTAVGTG